MRGKYELGIYLAALRLGVRELSSDFIGLIGTFLTYLVLVLAYISVFRGISQEDLARQGYSYAELIWYLGITEISLFLISFRHFKELQNDIVTGAITPFLIRPCPMWVIRIGQWSGQCLVRILVLMGPTFLLLGFVSGSFDHMLARIMGVLVCLPLACLQLVCIYYLAALACFWVEQADPLFWIWQKLLFFFGALLWPLSFYPPLLRKIAWMTPFPSILSIQAGWAAKMDLPALLIGLCVQLFWCCVTLAVVRIVDRRALSMIQRRGG